MRRVAGLVLALLLAACQTTAYQGDENSPYFTVPAGARLVLHRELVIPADRVDVYLQGGRVLGYAEVNPHHPFCTLDVRRRLDVPQTVAPDEFAVTKATQDIRYTRRAPGAVLASDGSPSFEVYSTILALRSERQPHVTRLTCTQWQYPPLQRHVTIHEMRQALGTLFTLRLGKGSG